MGAQATLWWDPPELNIMQRDEGFPPVLSFSFLPKPAQSSRSVWWRIGGFQGRGQPIEASKEGWFSSAHQRPKDWADVRYPFGTLRKIHW